MRARPRLVSQNLNTGGARRRAHSKGRKARRPAERQKAERQNVVLNPGLCQKPVAEKLKPPQSAGTLMSSAYRRPWLWKLWLLGFCGF